MGSVSCFRKKTLIDFAHAGKGMTRILEFNTVLYPIRFGSVKTMFNYKCDFLEITTCHGRMSCCDLKKSSAT